MSVSLYRYFLPYTGQLSSEFYTERYSAGDHTVSLILTGRDGSSKRFNQVFTVQPLVASSSHASEFPNCQHLFILHFPKSCHIQLKSCIKNTIIANCSKRKTCNYYTCRIFSHLQTELMQHEFGQSSLSA